MMHLDVMNKVLQVLSEDLGSEACPCSVLLRKLKIV